MAGSKKDSFENSLLLLIFNNTTVANIGSDGLRGSTTPGSLYIALYSAGVTDSAQGTELSYSGYGRIAVARASGAGGWTVSGNNASNASAVTFAQNAGASQTAAFFAVCKAGSTGVDDAIYWGDCSLVIGTSVTPEFAIGDLDVNED